VLPGPIQDALLTVFRSSLIEHLRQEDRENTQPAPIAYFYCVRNDAEPERANPDEILRSILEQLSCSKSGLPIREPVVQAYTEKKEEARGGNPEKLMRDETVEVILALLESNPATIIIDALDECDSARRQDLLLDIQRIIRESASLVKFFVSSRDDHDIVCRLANSPNLYINVKDNSKDIECFVHSEVTKAIDYEKLICGNVSNDLKDHIIETLISKAEGMWVSGILLKMRFITNTLQVSAGQSSYPKSL